MCMMRSRTSVVWKNEHKKRSPKDLRYNCILWLATHKQHTHSQIQANIGNQIEEEEEWTVWYDLEEGKKHSK